MGKPVEDPVSTARTVKTRVTKAVETQTGVVLTQTELLQRFKYATDLTGELTLQCMREGLVTDHF